MHTSSDASSGEKKSLKLKALLKSNVPFTNQKFEKRGAFKPGSGLRCAPYRGGDVKEESRVDLVLAEGIRARVAAARAAEHLAVVEASSVEKKTGFELQAPLCLFHNC